MTTLLTWSIQALALVAVGALAALTLANAKARLIFWQSCLLILLLLPAIEPWQSSPIVVVMPAPATVSVLPVTMRETKPGVTWKQEYWLLLIAAGAALRLAWIAAGFLRLRGYRKRATRVTDPLLPFDSGSVRWYVSETVPGPVTYGWLRPSILLPERVMTLPCPLREAIAVHELMHVHRRDWLFVLAEETVRSLLWFHPAIWYVLSRIQLAREQVVDSEVVRLTENRDGYLDALVEVAAQRLSPDLLPAPLFLRKRHLAMRVAAVLKEASMSKARIAARLAGVFSAMFIAARVAILFVPFVSPAQTVLDEPGVTVDAGATLLHRAPVRHPAGTTGIVTLEASLNAKGEVVDAHVLSGPDDLRKDALSSVLQWHYSPGLSRVHISMRFDPAVAAPLTVRSAGPQAPPPPPPPPPPPGAVAQDARLASIEFAGFSPEGERELRSRLPVREGDILRPGDAARVSAAAREFDSHAVVDVTSRTRGGASETGLRIRIAQQATPQIVFRSDPPLADAPPPPPPPPPPPGVARADFQNNSTAMSPPVPNYSPEPEYSVEASRARFQGTVRLSTVVDESGQPTQIRVISPLGLGLDQKAIEALQKWRFKPGMKDGRPIPVQASIEMNFRLPPSAPQQ